jgi:predicted AlkP superfamily phosphohydrolase/phosphomutase
MRVIVIGIDGIDTGIIDQYIDDLPNFKKIKDLGIISKLATVFPADSVPAWQTIYTGLNPAEHGIIRGKDYIESVEDFEKTNNFKLEGKTFWDEISNLNKKCLVLNPFLAYPAWPINGEMISGPAFVEGKISKFPSDTTCDEEVYGGYSAMGSLRELKADMDSAYNDTVRLWEDFITKFDKDNYDLSFVLFTTLDRIQHYTWRFYDPNDPLHEHDEVLSSFIKKTIMFFDLKIGELMLKINKEDKIVIVSDHGFGQRPYHLINFNELFRQHGLLKLKGENKNTGVKYKQKLRNSAIKLLSSLKILDLVSSILKKSKHFSKYKKSDFLIDKVNSLCYVDELFTGKKPYIGFNIGDVEKAKGKENQKNVLNQVMEVINNCEEIQNPKWVKFNFELYEGEYFDRLPDICMELQKDNGVEYELFGNIITKSATHFKLSGGHYDAGTFGYYSPNGGTKNIQSVEEFSNLIVSFFK